MPLSFNNNGKNIFGSKDIIRISDEDNNQLAKFTSVINYNFSKKAEIIFFISRNNKPDTIARYQQKPQPIYVVTLILGKNLETIGFEFN